MSRGKGIGVFWTLVVLTLAACLLLTGAGYIWLGMGR